MARCSVCGNDYAHSFDITQGGKTWTFDSFECAIHQLAPECEHCGCRVVGHGVEVAGAIYCCDHCVREAGADEDIDEDVDADSGTRELE